MMRPLLVALAFVALGQAPPDKRGAGSIEQPTTYQRGSDSLPVVVKLLDSAQRADDAAREAARADSDKSAKRWDKGATIANVLLTIGLLVAAGFQAWTAKEQRTIMDKQRVIMEQQTALTEKTVAEMAEQERHMAATVAAAQAAERAYVFVDTTLTARTSAVDGPFHSGDVRHLHVVNFGKTPARIEAYAANLHWWDGVPFEDQDDPMTLDFWLKAGESSGPIDAFMIATDEAIADAREGRGDLALSGRIQYRDVFGQHHETTFCFMVDPITHQLEMAAEIGLNEDRAIPRSGRWWED